MASQLFDEPVWIVGFSNEFLSDLALGQVVEHVQEWPGVEISDQWCSRNIFFETVPTKLVVVDVT